MRVSNAVVMLKLSWSVGTSVAGMYADKCRTLQIRIGYLFGTGLA